jgi:hypothetical protein
MSAIPVTADSLLTVDDLLPVNISHTDNIPLAEEEEKPETLKINSIQFQILTV